MNRMDYPALGESVYREVLPNGLTVYAVKKPGFRQNVAVFATRYGGADRRFRLGNEWVDTPAGVAHFLEHKMFDMPDGRNVLAELSARGASPNAFTSAGMTAYFFNCTDGFSDNLRTLLTYVSTPYYTPESVAKEQGIIAQEIRMYENSPSSRGYEDLMAALYAHHPIRESVAGTVESIGEITPETLYGCHKVFYHPSNMALACVGGDVEPEQAVALAREVLGDDPGESPERGYGPAESPAPGEAFRERAMAVATPIFLLGAKLSTEKTGRERLAYRLLGELALDSLAGESSGLYNDLYAQGLLSRSFSTEIDEAAGTMTLLMAGESRDPEAVRAALQERLNLLARRGLDADAFRRRCRARYGAELSALDRVQSYALALIHGCFQGYDAMEVFPLLQELEAEDAAAFLCQVLSPERLAMAVVKPGE